MNEQTSYRSEGAGLTRLELGDGYVLAGQAGYRERKIPLGTIDGFCIEPRLRRASPSGTFVLAFRDGETRRVYRLAVDVDHTDFRHVVAALGEQRSDADFSHLPPAEAFARMRVASTRRRGLFVASAMLAGVGLIALAMWIIWLLQS